VRRSGTTGFPIGLQPSETLEWLELDSARLGSHDGSDERDLETVKVYPTCSMEVLPGSRAEDPKQGEGPGRMPGPSQCSATDYGSITMVQM
jgi:hypothetical protein